MEIFIVKGTFPFTKRGLISLNIDLITLTNLLKLFLNLIQQNSGITLINGGGSNKNGNGYLFKT